MRIIALSDIHGAASAIQPIAGELAQADLVVISGDITHFGRRAEAEQIISAIERHNPNILAVTGNCDYPEVGQYLADRGMSLDMRCVVREGIAFVGASGSLPCPGTTPNEITEDDFRLALSTAYADVPDELPSVMVTHQPPYGTKADLQSTGKHVGSRSIWAAIEEHGPLVAFCGHIHEAFGAEEIGDVLILNPGPLRHGRYAVVEITDGKVIGYRLESVG